MMRLLVGAALLPTSCISLFMGARTLGDLAIGSPGAMPFFGGLGFCSVFWLIARFGLCADSGPLAFAASFSRRLYILGHELTHALAAWSLGAKVHGFHVGKDGGHVDLDESNFIIALAPYCVPLYTIAVVLGYRLLLWWRPAAGFPEVFLLLMGATVAFHLLLTFECLWDHPQPDLQAAGGKVFSLALIGLANGLLVTVLLKALFPGSVDLGGSMARTAALSVAFWNSTFHKAAALAASLRAS